MKILVTGASGLVGRALCETLEPKHVVIRANRKPSHSPNEVRFELEQPEGIRDALRTHRPDWVVHAAAIRDVDRCEREPDVALALNGLACGAVAAAASQAGAKMAMISTDYVFSGDAGNYRESDPTGPVNVYGRTKLAGEDAVRREAKHWLVCRTSTVFGSTGPNFVSWLVGQLRGKTPVRVVTDQRVNPTWAVDLAKQVAALLEADAKGTFHTCGADRVSRFEQATAVAREFGLPKNGLEPALSTEIAWHAPRPRDTSMSTLKVAKYCQPMSLPDALHSFRATSEPGFTANVN